MLIYSARVHLYLLPLYTSAWRVYIDIDLEYIYRYKYYSLNAVYHNADTLKHRLSIF